MPDQTESAVNSPIGRLVARVTSISEVRPSAPVDFRADSTTSTLQWGSPGPGVVFTHYRLRIDHDDGIPDMEFSRGNVMVQMFFGSQFALTAYNQANDLESNPVYVTHTFTGAGGSSGDCDCGAGFTHIEEHTMTADYTVPATTYTPCTGDMLTWFLAQDSTGGWIPTWNAQYYNAPTTDINGTPSTLSVIRFVGRNSKWYFAGLDTGLTTV